ncbi:killer toxin resistant protein [Rhodotorula kratochvilovae]
MRLVELAGLLLAAGGSLASSSPPVVARIEASWPAPDLVTQYLETVALEAPGEFFPFLDFLASHPHSHKALRDPLPPTSKRRAERLANAGTNPIFAPEGTLKPSETYALLEAVAMRSRLLRAKGVRDGIPLSLANREASVVIEGMRLLWEEREGEIARAGGEAVEPELQGAPAQKVLTKEEAEPTCESWIDVAGRKACSEEEFWAVVGVEQKEGKAPIQLPTGVASPSAPRIYPFDHVTPRYAHLPRFVFYASPTSPSFPKIFTFLYSLSNPKPPSQSNSKAGLAKPPAPAGHPPRLQFVLRWKPSATTHAEQKKLVLSGYGAALDIKKSDYLAIDDRLTAGQTTDGGAKPAHEVLEIEGSAPPRMEAVKKGEVAELSIRTAQFILEAEDPFATFVDITSAFPRLASHLPALVPNPNPHLMSEVSINQMSSTLAMRPHFFLNGIALTDADIDPFALLRLMRKERKILADLLALSQHFSGADVRDLLINGGPKSKAPGGMRDRIDAETLGELYDATDRDEGSQVIFWWNDLEKDRRYKSWSTSVRDLLRPTYPGSMSQIAKNLNNVVFILDLSQPASLALITENIKQFISRGVPIRFGVVPVVSPLGAEDAVETQLAQLLWYLADAVGRGPAISFLSSVQKAAHGQHVTEDIVRAAYAQLAARVPPVDGGELATYEKVQEGVGRYKASASHSRLNKARQYLRRLGVPLATGQEDPKNLGAFFMNGAYFPLDDDFGQNLQRTLGLHTQYLQQETYLHSLTDDMDAKLFFANLPTTHKRRNPYIFAAPESNPLKIVNLAQAFEGVNRSYVHTFYVEAASGVYNETTGFDVEDPPAVATMFIVTDLDSRAGAQLAKAALQLADKSTRVRVSFLHNPASFDDPAHGYALSNTLYALHAEQKLAEALPIELIDWIDLALTKEGADARAGRTWQPENPLKELVRTGVDKDQAFEAMLWWEELQFFASKLGFSPGENGIVVNGRVIGPFPDGAFGLPDFRTLLTHELEKRIEPVVAAFNSTVLERINSDRAHISHLYNIATSIIGFAHLPDPAKGLFGGGPVERTREYNALLSNHTAVIGNVSRGALFEIAVVVDPATELAQRWAPIVHTLAGLNTTHVRLYLNPSLHVTEVPIKRFYEYSFERTPRFDETTGAEIQPGVRFSNIPQDVLVTFGVDAQKSWLAFPKTSVNDLDNIRLADLPEWSKAKGVEAVLELESLIVEGHARDMPSSRPPRGLQLELKSGAEASEHEKHVDTTIMANLGYFQFKAGPGLWRLGVRPGRSSNVFAMESTGADGWKSGDVATTGDSFVVSTLEGLTLYPRFHRKPGHELTELLDDSATAAAGKREARGVVDRIKSLIPFFGSSASKELVSTGKRAEINVFTVASGLLYERMAFLMVVSVLRHTKSSVKFWFIQNFLSPSFKAFIPHMAREYGFDYELVTYKWPHWLRGQKEKQRTIWGYKILFLDVLFPLELDRVIFVDSDQIVRADLKELVDLDLQGAPYAYAPMGDDREEMEGFRFWKTGYWKNHLQGRPYHISALYVVDLDRFRQIAAGDRLRQQYQALSADPHSLANLDQDLPNQSWREIPIYTLPQEWLWCETWCSDGSLTKAKTIDLCNNPATHEPKLQRAKRLLPEWTVYDEEVAALARRVADDSSSAAVFKTQAHELEQAVQQQKEREDFVEEQGQQGKGEEQPAAAAGHVKDEL